MRGAGPGLCEIRQGGASENIRALGTFLSSARWDFPGILLSQAQKEETGWNSVGGHRVPQNRG